MNLRSPAIAAVVAATALVAAGCSSSAKTATGPTGSTSTAPSGAAPSPSAAVSSGTGDACATKTSAALSQLANQVLATGPHGEAAAAASTVSLSADEIAKVKAMHATAAIALHYGGNDWSNAQVAGLKAEFAQLGIKVVATTDANSDPSKQVSDLETLLALHPNIIVSIPTDPVATAQEYQKVAKAGVKLVFMDNVPNGMTAGKDYVSVVSADNYDNGVAAAHLMAQALDCKGKIGAIYFNADFFVTQQRYQGFKDTITKDYPDIQIVATQGMVGPDYAGSSQAAANAIFTAHPDLNGIWGVWDVPSEGIMAAARADGKNNMVITTEDLGENVAVAIAKKQLVYGLGAQRVTDQATTEAKLAAYGLLGKQAPAYVALNALPVTHANLLEAWQTVYGQPAPADVQNSYQK